MRKLLFFTTLILVSLNNYAQEVDVFEGQYNSVSRFYNFDQPIKNLDSIPSIIKTNLDSYLETTLGDWTDNIVFIEGLITDLDGYFTDNPFAYKRGWIATKYQFVYKVVDKNIGLLQYYVKIDMDEYGQITASNWPKKFYNKKNRLASANFIKLKALKLANQHDISDDNYSVELKYLEQKDKLCFAYSFTIKEINNSIIKQVFEFDWLGGSKVNEYQITSTTSH